MLHVVEVHEDLAGGRAVFGADDAFVFHEVHETRGAVVADAEAALDHRGRSALGGAEDAEGLLVKGVVVAEVAIFVVARFLFVVAGGGAVDLGLDVGGVEGGGR